MFTDKSNIPDHLLEAARQQTSPLSQQDVAALLRGHASAPTASKKVPAIAGSVALVAVGVAASVSLLHDAPNPVQVVAAPEVRSSPIASATEQNHHEIVTAPDKADVQHIPTLSTVHSPNPEPRYVTASIAPTMFLSIEPGRIIQHARDRYSTRQALASPDARVECLSNGIRFVHSGQPITLSLSPGSPCPVFVTSRRGIGHAVMTGGLGNTSVEDANELIPVEADEDLVLWFKNEPQVMDLAPDSLRKAMIGLVTLRHQEVDSPVNVNPAVVPETVDDYATRKLTSTIIVASSSGLVKNILDQLSRIDRESEDSPIIQTELLGNTHWTDDDADGETFMRQVVRFQSIDQGGNVDSDHLSSQSRTADSLNNNVFPFSIATLTDSLVTSALRRLQSSCRKSDEEADSSNIDEKNTDTWNQWFDIDLELHNSSPWKSTFMDDSLSNFSMRPFIGFGKARQQYLDSLFKRSRTNLDSLIRSYPSLNIDKQRTNSLWIDSIFFHDPSRTESQIDTMTRRIDIDMDRSTKEVNVQIRADSNLVHIRSRFERQDSTVGSSLIASRQQSIVIVLTCADGSKRSIRPRSSSTLPLQESSRSSQGAIASTGLYPNPATDGGATLSYVLSDDRTISVHLHDISGTPVQTLVEPTRRNAGKGQLAFTWSTLPKGIYLVVLSTDRGEQAVQRLIIQ